MKNEREPEVNLKVPVVLFFCPNVLRDELSSQTVQGQSNLMVTLGSIAVPGTFLSAP